MAKWAVRRLAPWILTGAAVAAAVTWGVVSDGRRSYPDPELRDLMEQARSLQDNLRVALEPAFKPMAVAFVRERYGSARLDVAVRSISVRDDGRFPVIVEVVGAPAGLYRQEKFLFWWDRDRWDMRYVEGDL
ncbi:MAG TPA: hypothetical protein VIK90_04505 [Limnochordales bacterium]